jgi:hypothetical protein
MADQRDHDLGLDVDVLLLREDVGLEARAHMRLAPLSVCRFARNDVPMTLGSLGTKLANIKSKELNEDTLQAAALNLLETWSV